MIQVYGQSFGRKGAHSCAWAGGVSEALARYASEDMDDRSAIEERDMVQCILQDNTHSLYSIYEWYVGQEHDVIVSNCTKI